ncbi:MAG: PQQ-dependent dehydrogenase, methanol/ethanol family [Acidobacteria bacterium]|nr:MAG: PQQ-dependent dehydrogenase, methanol/ethanol family [Acidobacteriota bacterium]PYR47826.1 MAG: PQQ-dependent dehydrogenase, methanol/ethanol family [Acidobacteriota bacterium]
MRQHHTPTLRLAFAALVGSSAVALVVTTVGAQYSMTVNKDRLVNAQNEPQNWLMMNGDYGSTRYSKLSQINRENVKSLRLVWAMALGGMQDVGQNGPEAEIHPLVDNGFLYTSDGWGTIYKLDARNPNKGDFVWVTDPGVKHQGNLPRTRGIALWEDLVIANLPDGRVIAVNRNNGEIVWDKMVATTNEFGSKERFNAAPITAEGKVIVANGAGDAKTRGWIAALDARSGKELWRWYVVPKPGDPGSETWKDTNNAWKTGGGGLWQTGSYDPATKLTIWGTGNPVPIYDPQARPGDNLYTNSVVAVDVETGKLAWYFQYTPNDSWDFDEVGVHMLYDTTINGRSRKVVGHFARNGFYYSIDRTNGEFLRGGQYVNDLNWTKGLNARTGKPLDYDPKLDVQIYNPAARALRGDGLKRTCPTWHGGIAHQPTAYNPVKNIAYGVGIEGCFSQTGAAVAFLSPQGGIDEKKSEKRTYNSDLYYGSITAFDTINHKIIGKAVTDIEVRSGATDTAGGVMFTALQDGWVVAYNDETLEELWRFNVGTPLKGAPVTYAIGPKQYLAVQSGGRHLHPVKFDKLENSSYLFVFALN